MDRIGMSKEEKDAFWEDPENSDYAWVRKEMEETQWAE